MAVARNVARTLHAREEAMVALDNAILRNRAGTVSFHAQRTAERRLVDAITAHQIAELGS